MRILIAPDKFKGSLTAPAVAEAIVAGLREGGLDCEVDVCPIADGGEGTTLAVVNATNGQWVEVDSVDALGRPLTTRYGLVNHAGGEIQAVMEMSAASGLALVLDQPLRPLRASTYGTGLMLRDTFQRGADRVIIGIGGSATNDGGMGMAQALGYRFLDAAGDEVAALPERFEEVAKIKPPPAMLFGNGQVMVACDVENPLLGEKGATRVYGPQKGIAPEQLAFFESRLERLADLVARDLGVDARHEPGAGAAGGLGFGLMAFCAARLTGGFDLVAEVSGLREKMSLADVVITGEGSMDAQTLCGKGPVGVARMARALGKKTVGLAGRVTLGAGLEDEFDLLLAAKPESMGVQEAMSQGASLVRAAAVRLAAILKQGL